MGSVVRVFTCVAIGVLALGACGKSDSEKISDAFRETASRSECVRVFETYGEDISGASGEKIRDVVTTFYTQAPLACPSPEVWDEVAEEVAPDSSTDWSSKSERTAVLRGMCDEVDGLGAPACD